MGKIVIEGQKMTLQYSSPRFYWSIGDLTWRTCWVVCRSLGRSLVSCQPSRCRCCCTMPKRSPAKRDFRDNGERKIKKGLTTEYRATFPTILIEVARWLGSRFQGIIQMARWLVSRFQGILFKWLVGSAVDSQGILFKWLVGSSVDSQGMTWRVLFLY